METRELPSGEGPTFEKVWALFQETALRQKETERMMRETDRKMQETDRKISKLGSRIGQLIEHLAASNILEKFQALDYRFTRVSHSHEIRDSQGKGLAEIDLLLENGEYALVIEVKSSFTRTDVKDHLRRMEVLRAHADAHNDRRTYLGAAAGALFGEGVKDYALEKGLYVVEQTGDTVRIQAPPRRGEW